MKLSDENKEWLYDFIHINLEKEFVVQERIIIDYGRQFKMKTGEIVNIYTTTKFSLGGKRNYQLEKTMRELIKKFKEGLAIDEKWEQFARVNNLTHR